jgi:hypothetical protein
MKRSSDSIDKLIVKQITLESKNGSVKLSVGNDGKINFQPSNKLETGSFSIDLKNEKIFTKKIEFLKDNSFLTSSLNIGAGSINSVSDAKFDPSTGKLIEDFLPVDFNNIRQNANDAIGKFDPSTGLLRDAKINPDILADIIKGVSANNKFDIDGKLPSSNLHNDVLADITKGVTANNKFDIDGKLLNTNLRSDLLNDITKGAGAADKFGLDGKLLDANIRTGLLDNITKGVGAADKFGTDGKLLDANIRTGLLDNITKGVGAADKFGTDGKLLDANIRTGLLTDITKGVGAADKFGTDGKLLDANIRTGLLTDIDKGVTGYNDFGSLDFSLDMSDPNSPAIKLSKGSRGFSTTNFSKTSIGLSNVENKNSAAIRGEISVDGTTGKLIGIGTSDIVVNNEKTFTDTRFTNVQTNASNGSTAFGYFNSGFLKDGNTPSGLKNSNISVDANGALQGIGTGIGTIVNNNNIGISQAQDGTITITRGTGLTNLTTNPLSTTTFTTVQSTANTANSTANTIEGRFTSGLLNVANANTALRNSNISVDANGALQGIGSGVGTIINNNSIGLSQASDGTITLTKGTGLSTSLVNPLSTTTFTTVSNNTNTVYNRFDNTTGRIKETSALNKRPVVIQYGSPMPSSPEVGDLVTVIGDSDFIGTTYIYGVREYDLANIPSDNLFKSIFNLNKTTNWNSYLDPYFTKDGSTTGQIKFQYDPTEYDYSLFITPNTSLTSIDRFYGETKFTVRYIPVTGSSFFTSNYTAADQGSVGTSGDPAIFFKIEDATNSLTTVSVFDATNDVALGTAINDFDGAYSTIFKGALSNKKYKFKTFYHIANNNKFYRYAITHNNITDATTTRRILIEKITIEGWVPYDDTGVKSRLYELAQKTGKTFDTFTGQHKCTIEQEQDINLYKTGLIVSSIGIYNNMNFENSEFQNKITPQEAVPVVTLCKKEKDKSVIGVICKEWEMAKYNNKNFKADGFVADKNTRATRLEINSLGEGGVWICNISGNLQNGDYITSCEIPGYGMKQDDDLLHNYTVAKITCDCDFNLNSPIYICEEFQYGGKTYRRAFVGCTYHCG